MDVKNMNVGEAYQRLSPGRPWYQILAIRESWVWARPVAESMVKADSLHSANFIESAPRYVYVVRSPGATVVMSEGEWECCRLRPDAITWRYEAGKPETIEWVPVS